MKKSPFLLMLFVLSAPLFLKKRLIAAQTVESQDGNKSKQVTELIKEYLTSGSDCPEKYKDAIIAQIAQIRNINKQQAFVLIELSFLATRKQSINS